MLQEEQVKAGSKTGWGRWAKDESPAALGSHLQGSGSE